MNLANTSNPVAPRLEEHKKYFKVHAATLESRVQRLTSDLSDLESSHRRALAARDREHALELDRARDAVTQREREMERIRANHQGG